MFIPIIIAYCTAWILTGLLRRYALRRGVIDHPNARSSHAVPTPRGGGVSFVLVFSAALALLLGYKPLNPGIPEQSLLALLLGGGVAAAIGFLDDHRHVPARWRFLTHLGAALLALYCLDLDRHWLLLGFAAFCLVWLLNLYNFMDGIDAIAASQAISVLGSAAAIAWFSAGAAPTLLLWLLLAAGVAGFLAWNRPPAKIFMGDAASGFLGLTLGLFAVIGQQDGSLNIFSWAILLSCFIVDATYTLLRRMLRGDRWYEAHRSHCYQKLAARRQAERAAQGQSAEPARAAAHRSVVLAMLAVNAFWLLPLAWLNQSYPQFAFAWLAAAWLPLLAVAALLRAGISE